MTIEAKVMRAKFSYTGIRVRDLDGAIDFFTKYLGMKLRSRVKADRSRGEFANSVSKGGKHWLEINWYSDNSPIAPLPKGRISIIWALRLMTSRNYSRS